MRAAIDSAPPTSCVSTYGSFKTNLDPTPENRSIVDWLELPNCDSVAFKDLDMISDAMTDSILELDIERPQARSVALATVSAANVLDNL